MYRIGLGQDSHALIKKAALENPLAKDLILGGVLISQDYYLDADSDGDVIIHSLCTALSTAMGGGSLGTWATPMFKQGTTDSKKFLQALMKKFKTSKYQIGNLSIMVEAQTPKLESAKEKIVASLAKLLKIAPQQISLAFTTGQNLTAFGQGKGIQVLTVVLIHD